MKTMSIREFGKKSNKNMNEAPLIITKGGKKAFIILPYEMADKVFKEPKIISPSFNAAQFVPNNEDIKITLKTRFKKLLLTKLF